MFYSNTMCPSRSFLLTQLLILLIVQQTFAEAKVEFNVEQSVISVSATANLHRLNATFSDSNIRAGPIFLLDKHTIFISRFEYSHNGLDNIRKASKWIKAKTEPESDELHDLFFVDDSNGHHKLAELKRDYQGENIYLHTLGSPYITHFSSLVIVNDRNATITSVAISRDDVTGLVDRIDNPLIKGGKYIFRYPKCCPMGTYTGFDACIPAEGKRVVSRIPVYYSTDTQFNDHPLMNITYEPFHYQPDCASMYYLDDEDETYMLLTGQLLAGERHFACIDYVDFENDTIIEAIFMCSPKNLITDNILFLNNIYVVLMYISSGVLIIWVLVVSILLIRKILEPKTIIILSLIYSFFYAMHFIVLATARAMGVVSDMCKIMGYIYQFLLLCSFSALFALLFEGCYRVRKTDTKRSRARVYYYVAISAVPIITTLVSIASNEFTLASETGRQRENACWFRSDRKAYFYYVPIILIIIGCMMIQISSFFAIREANRKMESVWSLSIPNETYSNMFRLGAYMNGIMTVCWVMEVLAFCFEAPINFWFIVDAVNSMQGIAIFCAFSYHYWEVWQQFGALLYSQPRKNIKAKSKDNLELENLQSFQD